MYHRIRRAMAERKLRPGTKLKEDAIGEVFGVSRTIVRKVLIILEQEGTVELPANRGAYVATPSPEEAMAVHDALEMIIQHIVIKLSREGNSISKFEQELVTQHIAAQKDADASEDVVLGNRLMGEFWLILAMCYKNPVLINMIEPFFVRYALALSLYQFTPTVCDRPKFQGELIQSIVSSDKCASSEMVARYFRLLENSFQFNSHDTEIDIKDILSSI